jgi:hypothetical protein
MDNVELHEFWSLIIISIILICRCAKIIVELWFVVELASNFHCFDL